MSTSEATRNTPPRPLSDRSATNTSNASFADVPERLEHSNTMMNPAKQVDSNSKPGKALCSPRPHGSKFLAASALTSLVKPDSVAAGSLSKHDLEEQDDEEEFVIPERFTKSGRRKATPFPLRLMKVLSNKKYHDIINWLPDGKAFTVYRPKVFVTDVLTKEFKQAKFSSFTRKLHRWGFQRHLRGPDSGAFYQEMFQRDRPDLIDQMTCQTAKAADAMASAHASGMVPAQNAAFRHSMGAYPYGSNLMSHPFMGPGASAGFPLQQHGYLPPPEYMAGLRRQQQLNSAHGALSAGGESAAAIPETMASQPHLSAAIEAEVSRRLRERVHAASISRQALAAMQPPTPASMRGSIPAWTAHGLHPAGEGGQHMAMTHPLVNAPRPSPHASAALHEAMKRSLGIPSSPSLMSNRARSGSGALSDEGGQLGGEASGRSTGL